MRCDAKEVVPPCSLRLMTPAPLGRVSHFKQHCTKLLQLVCDSRCLIFIDSITVQANSTKRTIPGYRWIFCFALGLLASAAQAQTNSEHPFFEGAHIPPRVLAILKRSCQECHSDSAKRITKKSLPAVAGQLTADSENAEILNFSRWGQYKKRDRSGYLQAIASAISSGLMPPSRGWSFGRRKRLTEEERKLVAEWAISEAKRANR